MNSEAVTQPSTARRRLMVVVARLYYVHGVRQREISERLGVSQARVSRVLRQAEAEGVVRTVVAVPEGLHPDLEDSIERSFGLMEVHVVEVAAGTGDVAASLGRAAARYFGEATVGGTVVGFTSWSTTLQDMALAFDELPRTGPRYVVEMLGDLGSPVQQHSAARATQAMATALGAEPVFLRTPGVLASWDPTVPRDAHVHRALALLDAMDVAFLGVGPVETHSASRPGDIGFSRRQLARARAMGAVAQLNQRFLDSAGRALATPFDDLVVGASLEQVAAARRRVVIAGGADKHESLAAVLAGGWVDVLVTDTETARFLAAHAPDAPELRALAPVGNHA